MPIGPNFRNELEAANLATVPMVWDENGVRFAPAATQAQRQAVQAVIDAHDPQKEDVPGEIEKVEQKNPITHRALREFIISVCALLNIDMAANSGLKRVKDADDAIKLLRNKL